MIFRRALLNCLMFSLVLSPLAFAQDETTQEPQQSQFAEMLASWTEIKSKMAKLEEEFTQVEDRAKQKEMRADYVEMIDEAKLIVDDLRDASFRAYEADNSDVQAIKTMLGIAINDVENGEDQKVLELGDQLISMGIDPSYFETAATAERLEIAGRELFEELIIRQKEALADNNPRVLVKTNKGDITLELFENEAPETVGNFISLVRSGHYDGLKVFRVIDGFIAQTGDPSNDGTGGPGYNIYCECSSPEARRHFTGSLSMDKKTPVNTGGSQFFLTMKRTKNLDGLHTVFGRIVSGYDVVDSLTRTATINPLTNQDDPIPGAVPDTIVKAEVIRDRGSDYQPNKVPADESEAPAPGDDQPENESDDSNDPAEDNESETDDSDCN